MYIVSSSFWTTNLYTWVRYIYSEFAKKQARRIQRFHHSHGCVWLHKPSIATTFCGGGIGRAHRGAFVNRILAVEFHQATLLQVIQQEIVRSYCTGRDPWSIFILTWGAGNATSRRKDSSWLCLQMVCGRMFSAMPSHLIGRLPFFPYSKMCTLSWWSTCFPTQINMFVAVDGW